MRVYTTFFYLSPTCSLTFLSLLLLSTKKSQCRSLRQESNSGDAKIAIVHAYADGPYNRSSFHLAGNPDLVAEVASSMAIHSIDSLARFTPKYDHLQEQSNEATHHPFVGLVDHVSVMPLSTTDHCGGSTTLSPSNSEYDDRSSISAHGKAALRIGSRLQDSGVQVFFYGDAHPANTPLATVRREQTNFFKSGGLAELNETVLSRIGIATVGAPATFVENFNIRLTPNCDLTTARSLTKFLRERDGGLLGVEGLTLPYDNGRYEMAGNLLRPDVGSSEAILAKLDQWVEQKLKELPYHQKGDLVETAYRVGTTAEQCLHVMAQCDSLEVIFHHDQRVVERFRGYLMDHEAERRDRPD